MKKKSTTPNSGINRKAFWGFAHYKKNQTGRYRLTFYWQKIVAVLLSFGVLSWIILSIVLYFNFKYNKEFDEVCYSDMLLLPIKIGEHRKRMGEFQIKKGLELFEESKFNKGFHLLRLGLIRSPTNIKARKVVAQVYLHSLNRINVALDILHKGIPFAQSDLDYFEFYFQVLINQKRDDELFTLSNELLQNESLSPEIKKLAAYKVAQIHFLRAHYTLVENTIAQYQLDTQTKGALLLAETFWGKGAHGQAIDFLISKTQEDPQNDAFLGTLSRFYFDEDQTEEARQYAVRRNIYAPSDIHTYIDLLQIIHKEKDITRKNTIIQIIKNQFSKDENAMRLFSEFAVKTNDQALAEALYMHALDNNFDLAFFTLIYIETLIKNKAYPQALLLCEELTEENPDWIQYHKANLNALKSMAHLGMHNKEASFIHFEQCLKDDNAPAKTLFVLANFFLDREDPDKAFLALSKAYKKSDPSEKVLHDLVQLEINCNKIQHLLDDLKLLLKTRNPDPTLLAKAYVFLSRDYFIFHHERNTLLAQLKKALQARKLVT